MTAHDTSVHKLVTVFSMGDTAAKQWTELLILLNQGYEIVSTASDNYAIHYILKAPNEEQEKQ